MSDYLSKLCFMKNVDVVLIQDTHTANDEKLLSRLNIKGYTLVTSLNSATHDCAT